MYTTSSQFAHPSKPISRQNSRSKLQVKDMEKTMTDTAFDFGNVKQQSFSFEVEAERQYVHRLKMQREKIQALYSKYDQLLEEMKKKDQKIREQQKTINQLNMKCKQYTLLMPELEILRKQNAELVYDNDSMRFNIAGIQQSYLTTLNEYKQKSSLNQREREKIQEYNEQLMSKLRLLQHKIEDKHSNHQKDRKQWHEKLQQVNRLTHELKNKHISELSVLNTEILHRQEQIDILRKEVQRLKEALFVSEQSNMNLYRDGEEKIEKISADFKLKLRSVKQQIQQHSYNNQILCNKISVLNLQIQKVTKQNAVLMDRLSNQKQTCQQQVYQLKLTFNQQKSILREHILQMQSKLAKLQKQLGDSLRRERQFAANIKRFEESEQLKRNLRDVERRELEKINRLLLIDK